MTQKEIKACASASGGVIFVPEELDRETVKPTKYSEFVKEEKASEKIGVFGKKKTPRDAAQKSSKVA